MISMAMFINEAIFTYLSISNNTEVITCERTTAHAMNTPNGAKPILFKKKIPKSFTSLPVNIP